MLVHLVEFWRMHTSHPARVDGGLDAAHLTLVTQFPHRTSPLPALQESFYRNSALAKVHLLVACAKIILLWSDCGASNRSLALARKNFLLDGALRAGSRRSQGAGPAVRAPSAVLLYAFPGRSYEKCLGAVPRAA